MKVCGWAGAIALTSALWVYSIHLLSKVPVFFTKRGTCGLKSVFQTHLMYKNFTRKRKTGTGVGLFLYRPTPKVYRWIIH